MCAAGWPSGQVEKAVKWINNPLQRSVQSEGVLLMPSNSKEILPSPISSAARKPKEVDSHD